MTVPVRDAPASNFGPELIPVEFLVLHYTACTLEETLRIFSDPARIVCAHFVIDLEGTIYDLGGFRDGPIRRGKHAGPSRFELGGKKWEAFNDYSIGIEIVNANGNLFPYRDAQYDALAMLARHLVSRFLALRDPGRVVGHEQIAGFRGKVDPGVRFDWRRFYAAVYGSGPFPERRSVLDAVTMERFRQSLGSVALETLGFEESSALSAKLEGFVAQIAKGNKS